MAKRTDDGYVSVWTDLAAGGDRERKAKRTRAVDATEVKLVSGSHAAAAAKPPKRGRKRRKPAPAPEAGFEGGRHLVKEVVESPYHAVQADEHRYETVTRNARHDPVEQLFHRKDKHGRRLIGPGEREAGRRIRELVEALGLDAVKSIAFDGTGGGGRARCELADHRIDAGRRMQALRAYLGADMTALVVRVAGYGETIAVCARDLDEDPEGAINGACSSAARDRAGFMFRLALRRAASFFGYGDARGPAYGSVTSWMGEGARPAISDVDDGAPQARQKAV
jgi:hypothetical protein